jgi:hypothetical protein
VQGTGAFKAWKTCRGRVSWNFAADARLGQFLSNSWAKGQALRTQSAKLVAESDTWASSVSCRM